MNLQLRRQDRTRVYLGIFISLQKHGFMMNIIQIIIAPLLTSFLKGVGQ